MSSEQRLTRYVDELLRYRAHAYGCRSVVVSELEDPACSCGLKNLVDEILRDLPDIIEKPSHECEFGSKLVECMSLIEDDGNYTELLDSIKEHYGMNHEYVVNLDRAIRFKAFKKAHGK